MLFLENWEWRCEKLRPLRKEPPEPLITHLRHRTESNKQWPSVNQLRNAGENSEQQIIYAKKLMSRPRRSSESDDEDNMPLATNRMPVQEAARVQETCLPRQKRATTIHRSAQAIRSVLETEGVTNRGEANKT